jgi:hypothetical protein
MGAGRAACVLLIFGLGTAACGGRSELLAPDVVDVVDAVDVADAAVDTNLTGRWRLALSAALDASAQVTYTGTLVLEDDAGGLSGTIDDWSNGARSDVTGTHAGTSVRLDRLDRAPYGGFRATFTGQVAADGRTMVGTFANDPSAGGGNGASGPWGASRLP